MRLKLKLKQGRDFFVDEALGLTHILDPVPVGRESRLEIMHGPMTSQVWVECPASDYFKFRWHWTKFYWGLKWSCFKSWLLYGSV